MMWAFKREAFPYWERKLEQVNIRKESAWDFTRGSMVSLYLGERINMNGQGVSRIAVEFSKIASRVREQMEEVERG